MSLEQQSKRDYSFENKYVVGPCIGRGGTGIVREVEDRATHMRYAAKFPLGPEKVDLLFTEARVMASLDHIGIVKLREILAREIGPVLVMERCEGEAMSRFLGDSNSPGLAYGPSATYVIGRELASAVAYMHKQNFLHLDLKPANVIVDEDSPKIVDLGNARPMKEGVVKNPALGTSRYEAPELRSGIALPESDYYSLGTLLREIHDGVRGVTREQFLTTKPLHGIIEGLTADDPAERGSAFQKLL